MGKKKKQSGAYGEFSMPNDFSPAASIGECTGLIPSGNTANYRAAKSLQPLETQYVSGSKKKHK